MFVLVRKRWFGHQPELGSNGRVWAWFAQLIRGDHVGGYFVNSGFSFRVTSGNLCVAGSSWYLLALVGSRNTVAEFNGHRVFGVVLSGCRSLTGGS